MPSDQSSATTATPSKLSAHLAKFAYSPSRSPSRARRVDGDTKITASDTLEYSTPPSNKRRRLNNQGEPSLHDASPTPPSLLTSQSPTPSIQTPIKPKAKPKSPRGYASPETYSHLKGTTDYLQPNLGVMFCGINPGKMSSIRGHHFAHPSNKFWKALAGSGFTDRLRPPDDDHLMPDLFNFGLTNLVSRVTSEQAELSILEMRLSIPHLLDKIQTHKPKVCCFVGKKIWDVFEGVIKKSAGKEEKEWVDLELEVEKDEDVESVQAKVEDWDKSELVSVSTSTSSVDTLVPIPIQPTTTTTTTTTTKTTTTSEKSTPLRVTKTSPKFSWDQPRPFILFHNDAPSGDVVKIENVGYTLFWVVPSTSGLERTPYNELVDHFKSLRRLINRLENGGVDIFGFRRIDMKGVEMTVREIQRKSVR